MALLWGILVPTCTLTLAARGGGAAHTPEPADALEGEACHADADPSECALSLRQLRAGRTGSVQQAQAAASAERREDPLGDGVPGGWGEAAEYVLRMNSTLGAAGGGSWSFNSCRSLGCTYLLGRKCQCHPWCSRRGNCCADWAQTCKPRPPAARGAGVLTLYHQTSQEACKAIMHSHFQPGTRGWCGGGIYFAATAKATFTKAIGLDSHKGCILQATVNVGRVELKDPACQPEGQDAMMYDSISFDPGDGPEYVVFDPSRISHVQVVAYSAPTPAALISQEEASVREAEEEPAMS